MKVELRYTLNEFHIAEKTAAAHLRTAETLGLPFGSPVAVCYWRRMLDQTGCVVDVSRWRPPRWVGSMVGPNCLRNTRTEDQVYRKWAKGGRRD